MGIGDLFKAKENEELKARIAQLEAILTPEILDNVQLAASIEAKKKELCELQEQIREEEAAHKKALEEQSNAMKKELCELQEQICKEEAAHKKALEEQSIAIKNMEQETEKAKAELIEVNDALLMQSFGIYEPKYAFANSSQYKDALAEIRQRQKDCIKSGNAATGNTKWTVNGSQKAGQKMVSNMQKLLVRAFNCECDDVIDHVKFNNVESAEKRIRASYTAISKLGSICGVAITDTYRVYKIQELYLAYEFQQIKQKEKDELKQLKAEELERAKLEKEIEEAKKKIEKEQKHYVNALEKLNQQIATASEEELPALEEKKAEMEAQIGDLQRAREKVDYRAANQKAGYVYVISNIGAFGEGIYKIGMTRRLEPMDRIDELGDASVPFDFDVHALIFTEDAPALETALHKAFENRKLNMVNPRREFFRVSLDEIKEVIKNNFDKTVEFIDVPPAEQFRKSELIRKQELVQA